MSYANIDQFKIRNQPLVAERLEEWVWLRNFLEQNPDVKERYEVHKTYEILNNEQLQQR